MELDEYQRHALRTLGPNNDWRKAIFGLAGEAAEVLALAVRLAVADDVKKEVGHGHDLGPVAEMPRSEGPNRGRNVVDRHPVCASITLSEFGHRPLDRAKRLQEYGDVLWYLVTLADADGFTISEVAEANVAKLRARYPDGFSVQASRERVI